MGFREYNEFMLGKKGIFLLSWCTRTQNTLGQFSLPFGIHFMTMVGQAIHGGAAIHGV